MFRFARHLSNRKCKPHKCTKSHPRLIARPFKKGSCSFPKPMYSMRCSRKCRQSLRVSNKAEKLPQKTRLSKATWDADNADGACHKPGSTLENARCVIYQASPHPVGGLGRRQPDPSSLHIPSLLLGDDVQPTVRHRQTGAGR